MRFETYEDLMKEVVTFYDDTDVIDSGWTVPLTHQRRIYHYINRAQEEIWYYRPWPWRMATYDFSNGATSGKALLPLNFSNVGPNGLLLGPDNTPWTEISYQDMVVLRRRSQRTNDHLFCIGNDDKQWDSNVPDADGTSGAYSGARYLLVVNSGMDLTSGYELLYEMTAPIVTYDKAASSIDIPAGFHHVLMLGTVAKLMESKGDARSIWRSDYVATLAKLAAELEELQSRPRQMPVTIGRMW